MKYNFLILVLSICFFACSKGGETPVTPKPPPVVVVEPSLAAAGAVVILSDPTKYRSGYAGRYIDLNRLSSGVYIMQVFFLPEFLSFDNKTNYWMKHIKFIKP